MTSIVKTREQDGEVPNPVVNVVKLRDRYVDENIVISVAEQGRAKDDPGQRSEERVILKLRTDHLNSEEKKSPHELCFDCQECFPCRGTN
jgi:hypothetical protein